MKAVEIIKNLWNTNKKLFFGITGSVVFLVVVILILSSQSSYSLSPHVEHCGDVMPENASYYVEIPSLKNLHENFNESDFGKSILKSGAWQNLFRTPDFRELTNILYFIEIQSQELIKVNDIPSFFNGPAGLAVMEDGTWIFAAETDIKSRIGLLLLKSFKSEGEVAVTPKKEDTPAAGNDREGRKQYEHISTGTLVPVGNIKASKMKINNGDLYMVMMGNYTFIANSIDTLRGSLKSATQPTVSLKSKKGMKEVYKNLATDQLLVYGNFSSGLPGPLGKAVIGGEGAAMVFTVKKDEPVAADIYAIDREEIKKSPASGSFSWHEKIHAGGIVTFTSSYKGIDEFFTELKKMEGRWKSVASSLNKFMEAGRIDRGKYFTRGSGMFVSLDDVSLNRKHLYPRFSIGTATEAKDTRLLRAVFKVKNSAERRHQGLSYTRFSNSPGQYYTPSQLYTDKKLIISSTEDDLKTYLSSWTGRRPVLSDLESYDMLKKFKKAPVHLVVNIDALVRGMETFYRFGAAQSREYTAQTVLKDVMPLFAPLKKYKLLHLAVGVDDIKTGRLVILE